MSLTIRDLDVIFLSYDEPRADALFADLRAKHPPSRRVHGVKGFDAAHKAAARLSRGPYFVTVDADNIVDPAFFDLALKEAWLGPTTLVAWPARNAVNGVRFGNGALKIWPRDYVLAMRTHEVATDAEAGVDFTYNNDLRRSEGPFHLDMPVAMSTVHANATPLQAFRAGFRAALRLTLIRGLPAVRADALEATALHRLGLWLNVGADAPNGAWMVFGSRLGCAMGNLRGLRIEMINDLTWFDRLWAERVAPVFAGSAQRCDLTGYGFEPLRLADASRRLGRILKRRLGLPIVELNAAESALLKRLYRPPPAPGHDRIGNMFRMGIGVRRNETAARHHYEAAAAQGSGNAMHNLARLLETTTTQPRDQRRALGLLREAAADGNRFAACRLAQHFRRGVGWSVGRKPEAALALLKLAADQGVAQAALDAATMMVDGEGAPADPSRSLLYALAAPFVDRRTIEAAHAHVARVAAGQHSEDQ